MRSNHLEALTASQLQNPLFLFCLSFRSCQSPSLSLLLCFLPCFRSDSLPLCMSSHLNYCRHCRRIATTPTGLTGKVNKLLKMKNSAGESRVIYSLHLLFLLVFPTPLVLAFLFSFYFYGLPRCHAFTAACIVLIFVDFFISLSVFLSFMSVFLSGSLSTPC